MAPEPSGRGPARATEWLRPRLLGPGQGAGASAAWAPLGRFSRPRRALLLPTRSSFRPRPATRRAPAGSALSAPRPQRARLPHPPPQRPDSAAGRQLSPEAAADGTAARWGTASAARPGCRDRRGRLGGHRGGAAGSWGGGGSRAVWGTQGRSCGRPEGRGGGVVGGAKARGGAAVRGAGRIVGGAKARGHVGGGATTT